MTNRLFISIDFPPEKGGIQNYVYGLVSHLDPMKTVVLTSNRLGEDVYKEFDGKQSFPTYRIGFSNKVSIVKQVVQLFVLFFSIWSIKRNHHIKELHFGNIMPIGLVGPFASKWLKVKFYPYIHGLDFLESKTNPLKYKLLNYSLKHATKIICNSNYTKNVLIQSGIDESKLMVIHPGIHANLQSKKLHKEAVLTKYQLQDKFVLLTVGRLVVRKGHDKVLEALKELVQDNPDIRYIICGKGPEREKLEAQTKKLQLEKFVIFTGAIDQNELEALYEAADLFIMLNRELKEQGDVEGYGIVFLEAGMHKLPVIGGNNGGVPDAVVNGTTGYLVNATDIQEVVNTIQMLQQDKRLIKEIGINGYKWVNSNCLWSSRVKLLDNLEG
jgi:phosphatidyl-myo-inositol dimannoside synthase